MAFYEISYKSLSREQADLKAIHDTIDYLGDQNWNIIREVLNDPEATIGAINRALGFAGVTGYPFHAICRKYRLDDYRAWMAEGPDSVPTDEAGFALPEPAKVN